MEATKSSVWENLPPDLQMKVLSYLPPPSCLCLRAVCRGWRDTIDSHEFRDLCSDLWIAKPWFLLFQRLTLDAVHLYDPKERKWYAFPLCFLPVPVCGRAAAGGLLCVEEREAGFFKALYVCDPLAQTWIKLPPMMDETYWRSRSVALVVNGFMGAFEVFVRCNFRLQVYDSLSASWKNLGQSPIVSAVLCKPRSTLYSVAPSLGFDIVPQPYQLLSCNLEDREWRLVDIRMPRCLTAPHLAENEGHDRIVMVGGVWRKHMVRSLRIWELNWERNSWDLVSKVPDHHWKQLTAGNWNTACAWSGEWISVASGNRMLVYNVRSGQWILSPPSAAGPQHGDFMSVFPFKPAFVGSTLGCP